MKKFKFQLGFYRFPGSQLVKPIRKVEATRRDMERIAIFLDVLFRGSVAVPEGTQIAYDYINPNDALKKDY